MPDEPTKEDKPAAKDEPAERVSALDEAKRALESAGAGESDDGEEPEPEDAASPEAIAKRVAALGEEDEVERFARIEEEKLAERRRKQRKTKKGGGLEAAASKKLAKIGAKAPVRREIATATDADPLIDRAAQFSDWAKKNQKAVGIVAAAAVAVMAGLGIYGYVQKKRETDASVELAKAVAAERGRIGDPDKEDDEDKPRDPRPVFKTVDDRREAALKDYRDVESRFHGTGAASLARLSEGSLLLDKHDADGALVAFGDVKVSPLGQADAEVKGRALEGVGFAHELKAVAGDGEHADDAQLDEANKAFRELENTDVLGFKELGMYHQARVFEKKGDKAKAVDLLRNLHERTTKPGENHPFFYLEQVADDRLRALDPTALPPKQAGRLGGPGGNQMNEAQMKKLIEQLQKQAKDKDKDEHGGGALPAPQPPPGPPPGAPPK